MVKNIYDLKGNDTESPESSIIIETSESNLDIVEFIGTRNLDLANLDEFNFYDFNNNRIFAGVVRIDEDGDASTYTGYDYGILTGEIEVKKNFENMTALEIIEDVIDNFTPLTFSNPNGITTSRTIPLYPSQNRKANQIIDDMHKILGTTHYVDFDKTFIIEYEGQEFNNNILQVGMNCNTTQKGWTTNSMKLVKNLTVNGDIKRIEEVEPFTATGGQTELVLANPYTDIRIEKPVGTKLDPKVSDITTGDYEIFKETKKAVFDPALSAGDGQVNYVYEIQTNFIILEVTQSEILSGTNPHEKTITQPYLKEVLDCKDYAEKYKNKFGVPLREVNLLVNIADLSNYRANQSIRVIDNTHLVNDSYIDDVFIIKKLERGFGGGQHFVKMTLGDSDHFSYNREAEISQRIDDLNETHPTADIFNIGITMTTVSNVEVTLETEVLMKKATLPQDILVYDINRTYSNSDEYDNITTYKYINGSDYLELFEDIE